MSSLKARNTPAKVTGFLDRAFNEVVTKKNINSILLPPNFVALASPRLAAPDAENAANFEEGSKDNSALTFQPSLESAGNEESKPLPSIVSLQPGFRAPILSVLSQIRKREHIRKIVGFIDYLAGQNPNITCFEHRQELAQDLEKAFREEFLTDRDQPRFRDTTASDQPRRHKRGYNQLLDRMYSFFRRFVNHFEPSCSMSLLVETEEEDEAPVCRLDDDSIVGMEPDLYVILDSILESAKDPGHLSSLSSHIDKLVEENGTIQGQGGRSQVANDLADVLFKFHLHERHKPILLSRFYRFLDCYLTNHVGCLTNLDLKWRLPLRYDLAEENMNALRREFPWLDREYKMTSRQQKRAEKAMERLKGKPNWKSFQRRFSSICA